MPRLYLPRQVIDPVPVAAFTRCIGCRLVHCLVITAAPRTFCRYLYLFTLPHPTRGLPVSPLPDSADSMTRAFMLTRCRACSARSIVTLVCWTRTWFVVDIDTLLVLHGLVHLPYFSSPCVCCALPGFACLPAHIACILHMPALVYAAFTTHF